MYKLYENSSRSELKIGTTSLYKKESCLYISSADDPFRISMIKFVSFIITFKVYNYTAITNEMKTIFEFGCELIYSVVYSIVQIEHFPPQILFEWSYDSLLVSWLIFFQIKTALWIWLRVVDFIVIAFYVDINNTATEIQKWIFQRNFKMLTL